VPVEEPSTASKAGRCGAAKYSYSITSSAMASSVGYKRLRALTVLKLITSPSWSAAEWRYELASS
jgi:hypothetical protein